MSKRISEVTRVLIVGSYRELWFYVAELVDQLRTLGFLVDILDLKGLTISQQGRRERSLLSSRLWRAIGRMPRVRSLGRAVRQLWLIRTLGQYDVVNIHFASPWYRFPDSNDGREEKCPAAAQFAQVGTRRKNQINDNEWCSWTPCRS